MINEVLDDEEELKTVPIINHYNNSNVVSDSKSNDDTKNDNKNIFDEDVDDDVQATHCQCQSDFSNEKTPSFVQ